MNFALRSVLLAALGLPLLTAAQQPASQLSAPADRITDVTIQQDHATYREVQQRIQAVNASGRPLGDYQLSKAQCWLDVSFHEYTRNDRGGFPQAALHEADRILGALEKGGAPSMDTPLVNDAEKLRPDLWEKARALQGQAGFACAQQNVACGEVELVHAGNEYKQQGWRHAAPYIQIAESRLDSAARSAASCGPAPVAVAPVAVPPPAMAPAERPVTLSARILFLFDRSDAAAILATSRKDLQELTASIRQRNLVVKSVSLTGHADRLNSTRQSDYNNKLSQARMQAVRDELARAGVVAAQTSATYKGDTEPLDACQSVPAQLLKNCLQSNRRVEVVVEAVERR